MSTGRPMPAHEREGAVDLETASRLAETFRVLGDATRVRIIAALRQQELCVGDLALQLEMSQSAISISHRKRTAAPSTTAWPSNCRRTPCVRSSAVWRQSIRVIVGILL